ncbi:MAG TPA: tetratricopeptide repeat protein [Isosphaeraceae bacterium]|jgi:tetratricopeptide (TPR) repeat protein|nr:tetratricopeptide repeat protein [Isosphaeraceae bacterium]
MKVPFRLKKRPEVAPAESVLVAARDAGEVLAHCARLGLDPSGRVFDVACGFLLRLGEATTRPCPGAVRLRTLAPNLLIPVDAELIPALLDDEAAGLVRDRGLIFLPGGRALGFDPRRPVELGRLLVADRRPGRDWGPLVCPPTLADRIEEILIDLPDEASEDVLDAGNDAIGTEAPRPADRGPGRRALGGMMSGVGQALIRFGQGIGSASLAGLGAGLVGRAAAITPRVSEAILGRQAAALRALLKDFRDGQTEKALRRALPLGDLGGARGGVADPTDRLPEHGLAYSLRELLGPAQRGPAGYWLGGLDVVAELTREYRKAAEEAVRRGDYRRAASIYGKLLKDYRKAADVLARGGLHRDAAILYLTRLDDLRAAARAFEAAGEVDRAVLLYRRAGDHEAAGDLLRRAGDDEAALAEYLQAAARLRSSPAGFLAAGDLLRDKGGRPDLAREQYEAGWALRPAGNAIPCALRLAALHAEAGDPRAILTLVDQADAFLGPSDDHPGASAFYNGLARVADAPALAPARDELRDRALIGLATKLRKAVASGLRPSQGVATLLGVAAGDPWPLPLVGDAEFAAKAEARRREASRAAGPRAVRFRVGVGVVSAVCAAWRSGEVFVGFEGGEVYVYRPERAEVVRIADYELPVAALATDPDGRTLAILRSGRSSLGALSTYERQADGSYCLLHGTTMDGVERPWLTPILLGAVEDLVGLWDGQALYVTAVGSLTSRGSITPPRGQAPPPAGLLREIPGAAGPGHAAFLPIEGRWRLLDERGRSRRDSGLSWLPLVAVGGTLRSVDPSWRPIDPDHLEVAGLARSGTAFWALFGTDGGGLDLIATHTSREGDYLAVGHVRPGQVAAVRADRVDWLRAGGDRFTTVRSTPISIPSAVACFASLATSELVVVCADGFVARLNFP